MNIMFSTGCLKKGGAERVISNLANYFINDNKVSIVTTIKGEQYYELDKNINVYSLDQGSNIENFLIKNVKRIRNLKKIINKVKPDIIVSFLPEPSYRLLFLKIFNKNLKVIVSVRNDPKIEYKNIISKLVMKLLYSKADGFVFQTEEAKNYFSKKIKNKSTIIPNPVNKNFICEPFFGKREKTIVTVGRLEKQKNHELLINAFSKIANKYRDYKLIIYGDGSLRTNLEEQIQRLKLENRVILAGQVDEIHKVIYKSGLFVLSSDYEGMPNCLLEAMALGIPCISTDCPCGGPKEIIDNGINGILVPTNDVSKMSKAIEKIILDDDKKISYSKESNKKISLNFNPEVINKKWKDYIKRVVD